MSDRSSPPAPGSDPVAIVGIGCLFPRSPDLQSYWANVLAARDCISDVPAGHSWSPADYHDPDPHAPDKTWVTRGGFVDPVPFDALAHGVPPAMLESIDTTQLLALIVAREALRDAGLDPDGAGWDRDRVAVVIGVTGTQEMAITAGARLQGPIWRRSLLRCGVDPALADVIVRDIANHFPTWTEQTFPGLLGNVVAGRIANRLDLGGTNLVVDAACASSLGALQVGLDELRDGRADLVLTGGADTLNDIFMFECFTRTPAFSRTNDARPFDAHADGILIGEGVAITALKRLADAERDGDRVYAVIKGIGSGSDGRASSIYAPRAAGQVKALERAYAAAGVTPDTVELVEAHGTGTRAGDSAEVEALTAVYRASGRTGRWAALGSVKSQIGHTKGAAGAAGVVKAALALYQRILPPTAKVEAPSPAVAASPFYLSPRARPWLRTGDHPRRAAVSAFGFGGSNFHVVLEEGGTGPILAPAETELFLVGADSLPELRAAIGAVAGPTVHHAARAALQAWRPGQKHVAAWLAADLDQLRERIRVTLARLDGAPARPGDEVWVGGGDPELLAFVFPGQGSQYVEMGRSLALRYPAVRDALDTAASQRTFPPPVWSEREAAAQAEALRATDQAQPAIGALSDGIARLLEGFGLRPDAVAGHSYGELVALRVAGVLDRDGLLRASLARGAAMAGAAGGAMAAVDAPLAELEAALVGTGVVLANRNHPEQGVISGPEDAVARIRPTLVARGWRVRELPVGAAFHSPAMAAAQAPFRAALAAVPFGSPGIEVHGLPAAPDAIRDALVRHLVEPVDWVGAVDALYARGIRTFVEVGPKAVLTGLVERCLAGRPGVALAVDRPGEDGDRQLKRLLAGLAVRGYPIDPAPLLSQAPPPDPRVAGGPATVWLAGANHRNPETLEPPMPSLPPGPDDGWAAIPTSGAPLAKPVALEQARSSRAQAPVDVHGALEATRASLAAFQDVQARTVEVHGKFLDAYARANESFARLFEVQARLVEQLAGAAPAVVARPGEPEPLDWPTAAPEPAPRIVVERPAVATDLPPLLDARAAVEARAKGAPKRTEPGTPLPGRRALVDALLGVVAAKTGFPRESLALTQTLDADLGVDSIKRVEILTAFTAAVPGLPAVEEGRMATARTLGDVLALVVDSVSVPATPAILIPRHPPSREVLVGALLDAVASKTGFPRESLDLSMTLDGDLGVDSIKRVEILTAVRARVPELPELDPEALGSVRRLEDLANHLAGHAAGLGFALSHLGGEAAPVLVPAPDPVAIPTESAPPLVQSVSELLASVSDARGPLRRREVGVIPAPPRANSVHPGPWTVVGGPGGLAEALAARTGALADAPAVVWFVTDRASLRAAAIAARSAERLVLVARGDGRLGRGGGPTEALAITGLAKTAAREGLSALAVDLGPGVGLDRLVDELLGERGVREVGLDQEGAWTLAVTPTTAAVGPDPLAPGDLVVATGGGRGVTAAAILATSRHRPLSWLLLGRTALAADPEWAEGVDDDALVGRLLASRSLRPREAAAQAGAVRASREIARTLAELGALGCAASYVAADGRDAEAVRAAIREAVERHGPVRGVVHGAGVLANQRLAELTPAAFAEVVSTKVDGLRAVLAAVDPGELRLCAAFTSVSGRFGNAGQASYAVANEAVVQALLALRQRAPGVAVKALHWGPWDGGMVTPALKAAFERQGRGAIPVADGAAAFAAELRRPGAEVVLEAPRLPVGQAALTLSADAPWLRDHVIGGRPVVPIAMVAEGFAQLASTVAPGPIGAVRDLRSLKGIALDQPQITVTAGWERSGSRLSLELRSRAENGRILPYYRGVVELGAPALPRALDPSGLATDPYSGGPDRIYGERLFHGPVFQAILAVAGTSARGLVATVRTSEPSALGVLRERWWLDPVAVDAVLQLAGLWTRERRGEGALPTAIGALAWHRAAAGPLECRLVVTEAGPGGGRFHADLVDADGLVATLRDGEYASSVALARVLAPA